jgi:hypothetical protein
MSASRLCSFIKPSAEDGGSSKRSLGHQCQYTVDAPRVFPYEDGHAFSPVVSLQNLDEAGVLSPGSMVGNFHPFDRGGPRPFSEISEDWTGNRSTATRVRYGSGCRRPDARCYSEVGRFCPYLSIRSRRIFDSSVWRGIPSFVAAPEGPDMRP